MNKKIKKTLMWTALAAIVYTIFATFFNISQHKKYDKVNSDITKPMQDPNTIKSLPNPILHAIGIILLVIGGGSLGDG